MGFSRSEIDDWDNGTLGRSEAFVRANMQSGNRKADKTELSRLTKNVYVLVDFENVGLEAIPITNNPSFKIIVFVGPHQRKINIETVARLQKYGERVQYVQIQKSGHNALDFHIAYYLGGIAAQDPDSSFRVISNDTGFDPLIGFMKSKGITVFRSGFNAGGEKIKKKIVIDAKNQAASPIKNAEVSGKLKMVIRDLYRRKNARPCSIKTLRKTIGSVFHKTTKLADADKQTTELLDSLVKFGIVSLTGNRLSYQFKGFEYAHEGHVPEKSGQTTHVVSR